ncbi:MAG: hypothetical protein Q9188_003009 [Gyalolechia gomerana]
MAPSVPLSTSRPQHQDTDPSGLVEALDREAARMHAANYLVRAREELVQNMQASGMVKQLCPAQGEEGDSGLPPQAQQAQAQAQGPPQVQAQPRPRSQIPPQVQAQWKGQETQGLGIAMGDPAAGTNGHQSSTAYDGGEREHGNERQKQQRRAQVQQQQGKQFEGYGKQGWELRDRKWSGGSLGSMGGIEVAREGMTGLVDRAGANGEEGKGKGMEKENGNGNGKERGG